MDSTNRNQAETRRLDPGGPQAVEWPGDIVDNATCSFVTQGGFTF
jgi:hypothetical protein